MTSRFALLTTIPVMSLGLVSKSYALDVDSGARQVPLLELYSSEGCSSCPPADRWVSELKSNPSLFKSFVPVVFHVDYWDSLGWKDKWASPTFTDRQRRLADGRNMYTPEFFLNGKEWRERDASLLTTTSNSTGNLRLKTLPAGGVEITFTPLLAGDEWTIHLAQLATGAVTEVRAGENSGSRLQHDFVVKKIEERAAVKEGRTFVARLKLEKSSAKSEGGAALAAWVTRKGQLPPLQSVGGYNQ